MPLTMEFLTWIIISSVGLEHIITGAKLYSRPDGVYARLGFLSVPTEDEEQSAFHSFLDNFHPYNWIRTDQRVSEKKALNGTLLDDERVIIASIYLVAVREIGLGLLIFAFQFFNNMIGVISVFAVTSFIRIGDAYIIYTLGSDKKTKRITATEYCLLGGCYLGVALYFATNL